MKCGRSWPCPCYNPFLGFQFQLDPQAAPLSPAFGPQPAPVPNDGPRIVDLVLQDLSDRAERGQAKYGVYLQPHNGRNALQDAYEEALDLAMYLRQKIEEEKAK